MVVSNPKIVELLRQADQADDAAIVYIYNEVVALGKADNLWYKRKIEPKKVCIHRRNRNDYGGSGWTAIDIGETVFKVALLSVNVYLCAICAIKYILYV